MMKGKVWDYKHKARAKSGPTFWRYPYCGNAHTQNGYRKVLTFWTSELAGKGRVYVDPGLMALKNPGTGSDSGPEVLKTHRTGFGPHICSLSSNYMGEVGKR